MYMPVPNQEPVVQGCRWFMSFTFVFRKLFLWKIRPFVFSIDLFHIFHVWPFKPGYTVFVFVIVVERTVAYNCWHPLHLNFWIVVSLAIIPHLIIYIYTHESKLKSSNLWLRWIKTATCIRVHVKTNFVVEGSKNSTNNIFQKTKKVKKYI